MTDTPEAEDDSSTKSHAPDDSSAKSHAPDDSSAKSHAPDDSSAKSHATQIDPKLLELLVCPLTKGTLRYDAAAQELISEQAKLAYPVRDGIPIMLPDEARRLDDST